jgi:ribosome-associated heat shock protein Hsp15
MSRNKQQADNSTKHPRETAGLDKVRIDKWLWAARFFKTRALAIDAIKGGKVSHGGARVKPSKELQIGDELTIRQGYAVKTVIVMELSDKRGPAAQAAHLYRETEASIEKREQLKAQIQAQPGYRDHGQGRPTKRERRKIVAFTAKS